MKENYITQCTIGQDRCWSTICLLSAVTKQHASQMQSLVCIAIWWRTLQNFVLITSLHTRGLTCKHSWISLRQLSTLLSENPTSDGRTWVMPFGTIGILSSNGMKGITIKHHVSVLSLEWECCTWMPLDGRYPPVWFEVGKIPDTLVTGSHSHTDSLQLLLWLDLK